MSEDWQPIKTMPIGRQVLVSDGMAVNPATRINEDTIACPILVTLKLWTHWRPFPAPPRVPRDD